MDWSFEIHKISCLKELSSVLIFSLFTCRKMLMRRVFDMWLLKACKQQEYRMEEKKVKVILLPGLAQEIEGMISVCEHQLM